MSKKELLIKDLNETAAVAKELGLTDYVHQLEIDISRVADMSESAAAIAHADWLLAKAKPLSFQMEQVKEVKPVNGAKTLPTRYRYKLRGLENEYLNVGADGKLGAARTLETLVGILEGIDKNRMCNFEYFYSMTTGVAPERSPNDYRNASPVTAVSVEIRRFKKGEQIIIKLYECRGRVEYVQFDSNYYLIQEVVKGFQTAINRLRKDN